MNRHDMLILTHKGLEFAQAHAIKSGVQEEDALAAVRIGVPAILRRQEEVREGFWEVGFSSHEYRRGSRLRVASVVSEDDIERIVTVFDSARKLAEKDGAVGAHAVKALIDAGNQTGFMVGIYGSLALQTLTEAPYFTETSDYDIYIKKNSPSADAKKFYEMAEDIGESLGIKIDCEIDYDGYGIKLKELLSKQKTVLCKGLYDVRLVASSEVWGGIL